MATQKATDWKKRVIGVRELLTDVKQNAYRIATELTAVYRDENFLADAMIDGDDNKATKYLDEFAAALFVILPEGRHPFHDLRAMLENYPKAEQWRDGDLSIMYDGMLLATERHDSPSPVKQTPRVKRAEYEAVVDKLEVTAKKADRLEKKSGRLEQRVATIGEQLAELRAENAELKAENIRLRTENEQLRSASSEPVAA